MRAAVASTLAGMLGLLGPAAWAEPIEWRPAAPAAARESPPPAARESPPPAAPPEAAPTAWSAARGQSPDDGAAPRVVELTRAEGPEYLPPPRPSPDAGTGTGGEPVSACPPPLPDPAPVPPPPAVPFGSPEITLVNESMLGLPPLNPLFAPRAFVRAEYLMWWVKSDPVPPLITTGPPASMGILGRPGTTILLGDEGLEDDFRSGARARAGLWLDGCGKCGIDAGVFFLGQVSDRFTFGSGTFPVLARPIFALNLNQEFVELIAFPGLASGTGEVVRESFLWGADANAVKKLCCGCGFTDEAFAGFRYLNLNESLQINEFIIAGQGAPDPPGTSVVVTDRFRTNNDFYGGQVGGHLERQWGRLVLDLRGSVALGVTRQTVEISGSQVRTRPGEAREVFAGGLLTAPTNIGHFTRDEFSVVPEVTVNLGYQIGNRLRAYVGYNFLYWSSVVRPGDQIDRVVDLTLVPNPPVGVRPTGQNRPAVLFRETDFWAQGLNFGIEARW